jgi:hypothetical protein
MMMNANNDQYERTTIRYGDSQPHRAPSWNPSYGILESQHFVEPNTTRHFLHEVITLYIHKYSIHTNN